MRQLNLLVAQTIISLRFRSGDFDFEKTEKSKKKSVEIKRDTVLDALYSVQKRW